MSPIYFFGAIVLMAYSIYQFTKPALPVLVPWIMLLASFAIFLYAASVSFRSKTRYQISVTLLDGEKIPIVVGSGEQAQGLLDSLTLAMDWHRNSDVLIDAARASKVRQSYASSNKGESSKRGVNNDTSDKGASNKPAADVKHSDNNPVVATSNLVGTDPKQHPSRVVRKLPPIIAALLRGRD